VSDGEEIGSEVENGLTEEEEDKRTEGTKLPLEKLIPRDAVC
jgi:hypothetical protein